MSDLPIVGAKDSIKELLMKHRYLVVVGDTGSGKTTQLPSYLLDWEDEANRYSPVAITQPRRVAATSVSARVAKTRRTVLGGTQVGYKVRFDDRTPLNSKSRLTFMTDGVLVRECIRDPLLSKYGTIMLDEAHERSVETDVLFGFVKKAVDDRKGSLKCIIASATLDAVKFCKFFHNAPIVRVPGRTFPVDVYHSKTTQTMTRYGPASRQYVDKAVDVAAQIHESQPPGHVLIFLTGQDEIERACTSLRDRFSSSAVDGTMRLDVVPLYGALPMDAAERVFEDVDENTTRKIVVATNVAETSITVPGVKYVVDSGYVKLKGYEPRRAVASLTVVPISKVAAEQRAGRAGRTGPGQCYRLYSKACFDAMTPETIPEILRTSMTSVVLALKSLNVRDVLAFDFLDPPDPAQLACALLELHALGALDGTSLTPLGRGLASLALDPNLARALVEAAHLCRRSSRSVRGPSVRAKVLAVTALLSSEDVWYSPQRRRRRRRPQTPDNDDVDDDESRAAHMAFRHPRGDLFSLATVFEAFCSVESNALGWADRHFLRYRALRFAKKAYDQLDSELASFVEPRISSLGLDDAIRGDDDDLTARALTYGLCLNAAERGIHKEAFVLLPGAGAALDAQLKADPTLLGVANDDWEQPSLAVVRVEDDTAATFKGIPAAICFAELKVSSRGSFAHNVVAVDPDVLRAARRRIGAATVRHLSGRPPAEPVKIEKSSTEKTTPSDGASLYSEKGTLAPSTTTSDIDAARRRFLQRKRARTT